ncbi:MAG: hypothetical protein HY257_02675 [Chloroflexi bacterium]|nr:hypothetical protein [Chloroflexota bacterium]
MRNTPTRSSNLPREPFDISMLVRFIAGGLAIAILSIAIIIFVLTSGLFPGIEQLVATPTIAARR